MTASATLRDRADRDRPACLDRLDRLDRLDAECAERFAPSGRNGYTRLRQCRPSGCRPPAALSNPRNPHR